MWILRRQMMDVPGSTPVYSCMRNVWHCQLIAMHCLSHLNRHWDLETQADGFADWFIQRWQTNTKDVKSFVEQRVENLDKSWSSYINAFMPTNMELAKK